MSYENHPGIVEAHDILGVNKMELERRYLSQDPNEGGVATPPRLILHVEFELDPNSKEWAEDVISLVLPTVPQRILNAPVEPEQPAESSEPEAEESTGETAPDQVMNTETEGTPPVE